MWGLPLIAWLVVSWAPAGLQLSFGVASLFSLGTSFLLRNEACRKYLGISIADKPAPKAGSSPSVIDVAGKLTHHYRREKYPHSL